MRERQLEAAYCLGLFARLIGRLTDEQGLAVKKFKQVGNRVAISLTA